MDKKKEYNQDQFDKTLNEVVETSEKIAEAGNINYQNLVMTQDCYFGAPEEIKARLRGTMGPLVFGIRDDFHAQSFGASGANMCVGAILSEAGNWAAAGPSANGYPWSLGVLNDFDRHDFAKKEILIIKNVVENLWPHLAEFTQDCVNLTMTAVVDYRALSNALRNLYKKIRAELIQALRVNRQIMQNDESKIEVIVERALRLYGIAQLNDEIISGLVLSIQGMEKNIGEDLKPNRKIEDVKLNAIKNIETLSSIIKAIDLNKLPRTYKAAKPAKAGQ